MLMRRHAHREHNVFMTSEDLRYGRFRPRDAARPHEHVEDAL